MKKLILIILLLTVMVGCECSPAPDLSSERGSAYFFGAPVNPTELRQDCWVYLRTYDRPEVEVGGVGRSKKGNIVDIRPVNPTTEPSEKAKTEWAIAKISLTKTETAELRQEWTEEIGLDIENKPIYKTKAYRKYKVDIDKLKLKVGLNGVVTPTSLKLNTKEMTAEDLQSYKWQARWYAMRKPFIKLGHKAVPFAFAETISTINKAGEDYDTLTLWEDAKDGDLVTDTRQETAECYDDDGELTDWVIIDGSTTNATYYMKVTSPAGERHNGTISQGFSVTNAVDYKVSITISDNYTIIEWCIIKNNIAKGSVGCVKMTGIGYATVQNNIIPIGNSTNNVCYGIFITTIDSTSLIKVYNNIIYDIQTDGIYNGDYTSTQNIYNNTIYGCGRYGINEAGNATFNVINNISDSNTTADYNGTFDVNTTNLDTADGVVFADEAGDDFHLGSSDTAAINNGTDNGTEANIDIDGRDRDAEGDTWDIGADEYVSAAAPVIMQPIINIF